MRSRNKLFFTYLKDWITIREIHMKFRYDGIEMQVSSLWIALRILINQNRVECKVDKMSRAVYRQQVIL